MRTALSSEAIMGSLLLGALPYPGGRRQESGPNQAGEGAVFLGYVL